MRSTTGTTQNSGLAPKQLILDAALTIASTRGYVGTTISRVRMASGLPASSIYWHFGNKDDLLAAALEHAFDHWQGRGTVLATPSPAASRGGSPTAGEITSEVLDLLTACRDRLRTNPNYWQVGMGLALESGPSVGSRPREEFVGRRSALKDELDQWWRRLLDDTVRPYDLDQLSRLTMAALDGLLVAQQSDDQDLIGASLTTMSAGFGAIAAALSAGKLTPPGAPAARNRRNSEQVPASDPEPSRTKLLEASAAVAAASGYEGATISRICQAAGLPASSLYWHFEDKADLFAEMVEHGYHQWSVAQPGWVPVAPGSTWPEAFQVRLGLIFESLQDGPMFLRLGHLMLLRKSEETSAVRRRFIAVRKEAVEGSADWFTSIGFNAAQAEAASEMMLILSDGLFLSWQVDNSSWDPAWLAEVVAAVFVSTFSIEP